MAYVSGKTEKCRRDCAGPLSQVGRETWDRADQIFVGEQVCPVCGDHYLYSRRPTKEELMAHQPVSETSGKKRGRPKNETTVIRTVGKGGALPVGAQTLAPEAHDPTSSPIVLPEGAEAKTRVLLDLSVLNDKVLAAHAEMEAVKELLKGRQAKWKDLSEELQMKLRTWTHSGDLPLFNAVQREADQAQMEASAVDPLVLPALAPETAESF